jgi:ABC-type Fe3+-hydroxamate transport system substrate-binding protein
VTTRDASTVTVTTSSSTTVTKATAGAVSDIAVGDHVAITGTTASAGVSADQVTDSGGQSGATGGPGGRLGPGQDVSGIVASVSNGAFTVTDTGGSTVAVTTSSATRVVVIQPASVANLAVGDTVVVTGTTTNGTVAATSIQGGAAGRGFGPGGPGGPGGSGGPGGPPGA